MVPPACPLLTPCPDQLCASHLLCRTALCCRYCECFASGRYCDGCNCMNCHNNREHETTRQAAVEAILERNPNAFRPKIAGGVRRDMPANSPGQHLPRPLACAVSYEWAKGVVVLATMPLNCRWLGTPHHSPPSRAARSHAFCPLPASLSACLCPCCLVGCSQTAGDPGQRDTTRAATARRAGA